VARIVRAVRSGERILVHGDYDVDGICSAALFTRVLRSLGARRRGVRAAPHDRRLRPRPRGRAAAAECGASADPDGRLRHVAHDAVRRPRGRAST
jgi:hypothetical protein